MCPPRLRSALPVLGLAGLLVAAGLLAGCRTGSPLHGRYNNFRAYYNTYYNAERALAEGERALAQPTARIDRTQLVEVFPLARPQAGGRDSPFQKAIDKSAELLRNRPTSAWADNALLLIGKAYYYQGNVVGAEQKFRETLALAGADGQLADEARFWLGRTLTAAERYDDGAAVLQDALAQSGPAWTPRLHLALGALHARAGRYAEAAQALREGVDGVADADLAARGLVLLGQVYELDEQAEQAAEAYGRALRRRPAYELAFAAEINEAVALSAVRPAAAVEALRRMRRDDKHYAHRAEVELAYARALGAARRPEEARASFNAVLYDNALGGTALRGEAHYRLGEYYRDVRRDYVRAAAHFDTAATSARGVAPGPNVRLSRAALADPARTAETFSAYARTAVRLAELDSLLALGGLGEEAFQTRISAIEAERRTRFAEDQRRQARLRDAQAFAEGADARGVADGLARQAGNFGPGPAGATGEAGFLGYRSPTSVQAGLATFQTAWGERPLAPNWRRRAATTASLVATGTGAGITPEQFRTTPSGTGPAPLDLTPIPRTPAAIASMAGERASLRYELANALFLSLGRPDSAAVLYRLVLDETPDADVSPRALYALAELRWAGGQPAQAEPLYRRLLEASSDPDLVAAARLRLGETPAAALAELSDGEADAYARARRLWTSEAYPEALDALLALGADAPPALAPRALLAAGAAATEWAQDEGRGLIEPIPLASDVPPALRQALGWDDPLPEDGGGGAPARPELFVRDLYLLVETRYPGTPYARQALAYRTALPAPDVPEPEPAQPEAVQPEAPPATAEAPPERQRSAEEAYAEEAYGYEDLTDEDVPPAARAAHPEGTFALRSGLPLNPEAGGVSWRVQAIPSLLAAEALLRTYERRGYRAALARESGDGGLETFAVLVGQFGSVADALAVRAELPPEGRGASARLVALRDVELVQSVGGEAPPD